MSLVKNFKIASQKSLKFNSNSNSQKCNKAFIKIKLKPELMINRTKPQTT